MLKYSDKLSTYVVFIHTTLTRAKKSRWVWSSNINLSEQHISKTFDFKLCYEILITSQDIDEFFARFVHLIHLNMKGGKHSLYA